MSLCKLVGSFCKVSSTSKISSSLWSNLKLESMSAYSKCKSLTNRHNESQRNGLKDAWCMHMYLPTKCIFCDCVRNHSCVCSWTQYFQFQTPVLETSAVCTTEPSISDSRPHLKHCITSWYYKAAVLQIFHKIQLSFSMSSAYWWRQVGTGANNPGLGIF